MRIEMTGARAATRTKRAVRDDLEDYIAERSARNPNFPQLMASPGVAFLSDFIPVAI